MQKSNDPVWILYLVIWNRHIADVLSILELPESLVHFQKIFFQQDYCLPNLFPISLIFDEKFVRRTSVVDGFFRMDVGFSPIENHCVFYSDAQSLCKMDTKLDHLSESYWNLLLILTDHAGLLEELKLKQRFVELLTLSAIENIVKVIQNSSLPLKEYSFWHFGVSHFFVLFYTVFLVTKLVCKSIKNFRLYLNLLIPLLLKALKSLCALNFVFQLYSLLSQKVLFLFNS